MVLVRVNYIGPKFKNKSPKLHAFFLVLFFFWHSFLCCRLLNLNFSEELELFRKVLKFYFFETSVVFIISMKATFFRWMINPACQEHFLTISTCMTSHVTYKSPIPVIDLLRNPFTIMNFKILDYILVHWLQLCCSIRESII